MPPPPSRSDHPASLDELAPLALLTANSQDLAGASLVGGSGEDTLQLTGGGQFDLRLPEIFTGIEIVEGSDHHDSIVLDEARFAGIGTFYGGAVPAAYWDELVLEGNSFDFRGKTLIGIDRIVLRSDGAVLTVADAQTAMLASGVMAQNDRLEAPGVTFTEAQRRALHRQGIDTVVDAAGTHANAAPTMEELDGDRVETEAGATVFVDAGRNTVVSDDDGSYTLLSVAAPRGLDAPGRLRIDTGGSVGLSASYMAGSVVTVDGVEIGMLWEASDAGLSIAFNGMEATSARVQEIVRALTFTSADTPPEVSREQDVTITLADEGGRKSSATVTLEQDVAIDPPRIRLSHAEVRELSLDGTLVGFLTAAVPGLGDSFTFRLLDDAGGRFALHGDRLVVANGARLDHEQSRSHIVIVRAMAPDGTRLEETFTIAIGDLVDETGAIGDADGTRGVRETEGEAGKILVGGRGNDRLVGGKGQDVLYGKGGNDILRGGENKDVFVFDTKPRHKTNVDRIGDFNAKQDKIRLDNKVFKALGKKGTPDKPAQLSKAMFWKGAAAQDSKDRIGYDPKSGALYYDADGSGSGAAAKIATLPQKLKGFNHHDFFVI